MVALYKQREPFYRMTDLTVETTDRTPDELARFIADEFARRAGNAIRPGSS
jgi:hypothetical protein